MENEKRFGKISAIIGIVTMFVALIMRLVRTLIEYTVYDYYYDLDVPSNMINIMNVILMSAFMSLFIVSAVMYVAGGKKWRIPLATGFIAYALVFLTWIGYELYWGLEYGRSLFRILGYIGESLLYNSPYLLLIIFVIVICFIKLKGIAVPIIGYGLTGIIVLQDLFTWFNEELWLDAFYYDIGEQVEVIIYRIFLYLSPSLLALSLIFFIPLALYIPSNKKKSPRPAYATYGISMGTPQAAPSFTPVSPMTAQPQYQPAPQAQAAATAHPSAPALNDIFLANQTIVTDFLEARGYSVKSDEESLSVVKNDGSADTQNNVNTFVAKADGIYNFVEVIMGGYDLRKRLSCPNPQTARIMLLSKYVMEVVKGDSSIINLPDFKALLDVLAVYENVISQNYSRTPNYRNTYILEDYFDLMDIRKKISFMQ